MLRPVHGPPQIEVCVAFVLRPVLRPAILSGVTVFVRVCRALCIRTFEDVFVVGRPVFVIKVHCGRGQEGFRGDGAANHRRFHLRPRNVGVAGVHQRYIADDQADRNHDENAQRNRSYRTTKGPLRLGRHASSCSRIDPNRDVRLI